MDEKKTVGILLRVSTSTQAKIADDEADIPTQRTACMRFIEKHPNWVYEKEYMEVGVSGYKNSIAQRDKLLEAKDDIAHGRIKVLVVFMFDRLGRREEETPFIVKSFVDMGCEVWSVQEGQRRFDLHVDSLLNFITFWQASGESKKTSERVTNAMNQMAEAGLYTGGHAPYGYKAVETGRLTKKKIPERTLVIDEDEARIVRTMFDLALSKHYGAHRIAQYLNEQKIPTRSGKQWGHAVISNILSNPIYKGQKCYNRTTTKGAATQKRVPAEFWIMGPHNPDIMIISEDDWDRLHRIKKERAETQRKQQAENERIKDYDTVKSRLLFAGLAYCDICGSKMYTGYSPYRWTTKDGVIHRRRNPVYRCSRKSSGMQGCNGQVSYKPETFEPAVNKTVSAYLDKLKKIDLVKGIKELRQSNTSFEEKQFRDLTKKIQRLQDEIKALEDRLVKAIMGEINHNEDMLTRLLTEREEDLKKYRGELEDLQKAYKEKRLEVDELEAVQKLIPVWRETFETADMETKKVMLRMLIKRIYLSKGCVRVHFKINLGEFIQAVGGDEIPPPYGGETSNIRGHKAKKSNHSQEADFACNNGEEILLQYYDISGLK